MASRRRRGGVEEGRGTGGRVSVAGAGASGKRDLTAAHTMTTTGVSETSSSACVRLQQRMR